MAGCRQARDCSEQLSPSLSLLAALVKILFTLLFTRISMSENKAFASISEGRDRGNSQLFFLSLSLSVSLYHTSPSLFLYITRFKAQIVACGECLIANSFLSALPFRLYNPNPETLLCLSWSNPRLWPKLSPLPSPSCNVLTVHSDPDLLDVCWGNFVGSFTLVLARLLACDPQDLQVLLLTFKLSAW